MSYNEDLDQLPDAGIGQILSAYEIKLWDLKEDEEYTIPEGKKVRVMIPLPENAGSFSSLSVAHYLGNSEYEYYTLPTEEYPGTLAVINIEGMDYLTFETASFSPFNVGGSQLVGPGTQIPQSGSSSNQSTGNSSSGGNTSGASTGTSGNSQTGSSGTALRSECDPAFSEFRYQYRKYRKSDQQYSKESWIQGDQGCQDRR